jgi:Icc-related predicted phosphoesterase
MKVVMISDTHSAHRKVNLPKGDILIHAGDLCNSLGTNSVQMVNHIRDCDDWFGEQEFEKVICVAGNHDFPFEEGVINTMKNAIYLENQHYVYKGIKFFGSPYQLPFYGAFNANEDNLKEMYDKVDDDTDVIISHGPPYGILDAASMDHAGSIAFKYLLDRVNPKLVVFGHIHGSYGKIEYNGIHCFNASQAGKSWTHMEKSPWVFEL